VSKALFTLISNTRRLNNSKQYIKLFEMGVTMNKLKTILVLLILFLTLFTPLTPIVDTTQLKTHGSSQETPLAYTVEAPYIVPLAMGSTNIPVGFVKVWNDNEYLYVLFEIDLDSYPTYKMYQTHLYLSKTQPVWSAPGLWPYSNTYPYPNMVTSDLYKIPLADIDGGVGVNENNIHNGTCNNIPRQHTNGKCLWRILQRLLYIYNPRAATTNTHNITIENRPHRGISRRSIQLPNRS